MLLRGGDPERVPGKPWGPVWGDSRLWVHCPSGDSATATRQKGTPDMTAVAIRTDLDALVAPAEAPVVSATGLVRRYGEGATSVEALRGVSIDIEAGRMTAIMGPSGSGKSTLM